MMKNPHPAHNRMTALSVALGLIMLLFIAALYSAQILNGSENRARSIASNATWQSVEASRVFAGLRAAGYQVPGNIYTVEGAAAAILNAVKGGAAR